MKCWHCKSDLIWGGDESIENMWDDHDNEHDMLTNLSCNNCKSLVLVYRPIEKEDNDNG